MAQDIRKLLQQDSHDGSKLSKDHQARFATKLEAAFAEETSVEGVRTLSERKASKFSWMKVAAIAVCLIAVSVFGYYSLSEKTQLGDAQFVETSEENNTLESPQLTLGSLSPDLKKVEDYYVTGINVQLASLQINDDNRDVIEGYMEQLEALSVEYTLLNTELNEVGPTESTITALIDNLQLRLELLFKLKNKLKELKNQNNEAFNSIQI